MIVLGIIAIWLILTVAGFAGLSLLSSAATREEELVGSTSSESQARSPLELLVPVSGAMLG